MSAELCNNVSRYDGVKYGYRTKNYTSIDELYTNSRTEAFGEFLKSAILFGSETLSTENYKKVYDKALRVRRVISETMNALLADCDALVMPAAGVMAYDKAMVENDKYLPYKENFFTAPASITGLPVVVAGGVQLVGKAFSEDVLLDLAELV
jgi:aspartyl-tRNA(Asn)/glutamyl-tRNA(Gln) amidotransferase subunit A